MQTEINHPPQEIATSDWKEIAVEYGREILMIRVPPQCDTLSMKEIPILLDPRAAYEEALANPIGCPPLAEIIRKKGKPAGELTAAVTVSDITRPVPYRGESGLLRPLLNHLEAAGIPRRGITIIIGNGMHRPSTPEERSEMFGEEILLNYPVIDHDCEDLPSLTFVGKSGSGGDVFVNGIFYGADLRIGTGLVESHFMVGLSGGRKAICPGLVDKRTIEKFHSPAFLESPLATNLVLEGNPCHEESLAISRTVGVDFIVNATLDKEMRLTGVFAGDLEAAHKAAGDLVRDYVSVPATREYDIILTHGGYVGRNHYQAVKAVCNALPIIHQGGVLIVATDNRDEEPIGGPEYRSLLHLLKIQGEEHYLRMLEAPGWRFTKDQWEPEMWGKVLRKVGEEGLIYCTHTIPRADYCLLPGRCGLDFLPGRTAPFPAAAVGEMVENALLSVVAGYRARGIEPSVAFIREGPYTIPFLAKAGGKPP
ncbi:MAG: nickel-dependent lactate racemase [Proteobacteria bacterium]|nr:nickel-dependent lactate racemase [Pseudomonadota bacterium]MBU2260324.1 nickel-dependent lactate racemase [Pseudomonadota bacterium]